MPGRASEKVQPGLGWERLSSSRHGVECGVLRRENRKKPVSETSGRVRGPHWPRGGIGRRE